ncbi:MAG: M56 family metallopeptidase [Sandaracinus sp.]
MSAVDVVEAWLTYCVHAGAFAALAAAFVAWRPDATSTGDALWRLALVGPVGTTLLASVLGHRGDAAPAIVIPARTGGVGDPSAWVSAAQWVVLGSMAIGALRVGMEAALAHRALRSRTPVRDRRVLDALSRAQRRFSAGSVRLTCSAHVRGACAFGSRDICVRLDDLAGLDRRELSAVLAHELAHLERRDGLWFPLTRFIETVLWLQPAARFVATRLRASAEICSDERAVRCASRRTLAGAIVRVAERAARHAPVALFPTVGGGSLVLRRVRRLTQRPAAAWRPIARGARLSMACVVVAISTAYVHLESSGATPGLRPDALAAMSDRALWLDRHAHELEAQLAVTPELEPTRIVLEQDLRHAHEERAFLERRLLAGD